MLSPLLVVAGRRTMHTGAFSATEPHHGGSGGGGLLTALFSPSSFRFESGSGGSSSTPLSHWSVPLFTVVAYLLVLAAIKQAMQKRAAFDLKKVSTSSCSSERQSVGATEIAGGKAQRLPLSCALLVAQFVVAYNFTLSILSGVLFSFLLRELLAVSARTSLFQTFCDPDATMAKAQGALFACYYINYIFK